MDLDLRLAGADDWEAFRALRLRALVDSPDAFGATLAEARSQPESVWRERVDGSAGPVVLARLGGVPVGMGGLYVPEGGDRSMVWGMWVAPEARGRGLADAIVRRLVTESERFGRPVELHVTDGNDGARRLYERNGFVDTGQRERVRAGSALMMGTLRLRD
jgi:ribosomal protein S18 acetylase RimI-like enzyme